MQKDTHNMIHGACSEQEHPHRQILGNVRKKQIEALVNCRRGVHTTTTCPNLQLKLHKKTKTKHKYKQTERKESWKMTKGNIQTLAMNSWMRVYAGRGPPTSLESSMSCTMSTFFMRASMLGASKDVALVSRKVAFLLRGKERKEVPLWEGVTIDCGSKAEGLPEGATDGATEGTIDGLRGKVGGWTGVFEADRVTTWEVAGMAVFFAVPFPLGALGGGGGSSTMSGSSKVTMYSSGALFTRLANRGFSSPGTNPIEQSKYHPAACKCASGNLVVCVVVYT